METPASAIDRARAYALGGQHDLAIRVLADPASQTALSRWQASMLYSVFYRLHRRYSTELVATLASGWYDADLERPDADGSRLPF